MMMEGTKAYGFLRGLRGRSKVNREELEELLVRFSNIVVDFPEIAEIDINPLVIADGRPCAVNARIVIDRRYAGHTSRYPQLAIMPYPARYITPWRLTDGTEVLLRPIRSEDEPLEQEMLASLSEESVKRRFFSSLRDFPHEWLTLICNIDYDRHMAIVAETTVDGRKMMIASGRLVMEPNFRSGKMGLVVRDLYQGKGLGRKVLEMLIEIGREKGLEEVVGDTLTENERMLHLTRSLGFSTHWAPGGTTKTILKLRNAEE
jgi:acetyltransferase